MDPNQTGYRYDWRLPLPPAHQGTRQTFHNESGTDLRPPSLYDVDCMFRCGGCPAKYHMIWQLHEHLQLHASGGSYHYNHRTRTAFPKYDTACHETQTDTESNGIKSAELVCTETQTEEFLTNFVTGRADNEESNDNEEDVKVKLETTEAAQYDCSNTCDDSDTVKVPVLTAEDLYSADTDEETSVWYQGTDYDHDGLQGFSGAIKEQTKPLKRKKARKVRLKGMKKKLKKSKKSVKKRKHSTNSEDTDVPDESPRQKSVNKKPPVQCKYCLEFFPNNLHLKRHSLQAHPLEKNHACRNCDEAFVTEIELQKHRRMHLREKYECQICKKHLSSPQNLQDHITMHTGEKMFECKDCGTYFRSRSQLSLHASRKHNPNFDHMCENCGKVFKCRQNLQGHIKCCLDIRPFRCEICGKRFPRNTNLNVHMRKHTGEKPFVCHTCGMKFMHSNTLTKHMLVHTGERKYSCEVCGMKFKAHNALKDHIRIHSQDKRFTCQYCGKGFIKKCNLVTHLRQHTGETPYKCQICGQGYKQNVLLKTHMQTHKHEPVQLQSTSAQPSMSMPPQPAISGPLDSEPMSAPGLGAQSVPPVQEPSKMAALNRSMHQLEHLPVHSQPESSNGYQGYVMTRM